MNGPVPDAEHVTKSSAAIAMSVFMAAVWSLIGAWVVVKALPIPDDAVVIAGWGTTAVAEAFFIGRAFRTKLVMGSEEVLIQNYWRTFRIPWSAMSRIIAMSSSPGVVPQSALAFETPSPWRRRAAHATAWQNRASRQRTLEAVQGYADDRGIEVIAYIGDDGNWHNPPGVAHQRPEA
jgi:hypothetical protein